MILICGIPTEPPLAMVLKELERADERCLVFNQRQVDSYEFEYRISNGVIDGHIRLGASTYSLAEITAAYVRLMDVDRLPELDLEAEDSARRSRWRNMHATLEEWLELMPGCVVNRSSAMGSNFSKPYQATLIAQQGFLTPETLITNEPDRVLSFLARHRRVIYKSISGVRSIVVDMADADVERLESIRVCPVQFQERIDGVDVRVHVVGGAIFATEIASEAVDYRYSHRTIGVEARLQPTEIGATLMDRCRGLVRALGLEIGGIDLKLTADGRVYCFEVNPSPAYSYYEMHTGQPIARAIAEHLAAARRSE